MTTRYPDASVPRIKRPDEEFPITFDFVDDLDTGDSLLPIGDPGSSVTAIDNTGADVSDSFLEGATVAGTAIEVQVQGGTDGRNYDVIFEAKTNYGHVFERIVRIRVRA